jgi:hypothetical protein
MRYSITLFVSAVLAAQDWQSALRGLPERAPADTSLRDVQRFEQNIRTAAPYLSTPQNIEANRQYVRQMWTYLAALEVMARTPGANSSFGAAVGRTREMIYGMGLAYPYWGVGQFGQSTPPPPEPPPVKPGQPPFSVEAPDLGTVPPAEQAQADEMVGRYETAAARAAAKWQENDVLSQSLGARGMTVSVRTTEAVVRMQMFLEMAAGDLRRHNWKAALEDIQKVEYVTAQVGR